MIRTLKHDVDDSIERLLIVSDVHAFIEPLHVFDKLRAAMRGKSQVVFNGDLYCGGVRPVEATDWVMRNAGELATLGNHDEDALRGNEGSQPPFTEAGAWQRLRDDQRDWLRIRPHRLELSWRGRRIVAMHGHLTREGRPIPWYATPEEQIAAFGESDADLCLTGHTHFAFVRQSHNIHVANSGSMFAAIVARDERGVIRAQSGKPEVSPDDETRCSFLSVTESQQKVHVEIVRFDYDRKASIVELERAEHAYLRDYRRLLLEGIVPAG